MRNRGSLQIRVPDFPTGKANESDPSLVPSNDNRGLNEGHAAVFNRKSDCSRNCIGQSIQDVDGSTEFNNAR